MKTSGFGQSIRFGRVLLTVVVAVVGVGAGVGGGFWYAKRQASGDAMRDPAGGGDPDVWYTCGMHPDVQQLGPGICPICQMKLTPMKTGDDDADAAASGPRARRVLYWRAPMDPNFTSDRPGKSPMGMDLVPVYADAARGGSSITIDPVTIQNMGVRTTRLARGPLVRSIRALGQIDYDERTVGFVTTRFEGYIRKLHVDETGQPVSRGQDLFDVYSPEIYEAQSAFLTFLSTQPDGVSDRVRENAERNLEMAVSRLRLYDVSDDQIDELKRTRKMRDTLTIRSPFDGVVTDKRVLDGMYIKPGMQLYTIADLSKVWVLVSIYEYQLPWVRVGQDAIMELPYFSGERFRGKLVYIYPYLSEHTRDTKARLEFDNPDGKLRPNMVATVRLEARLDDDALLIPREAYIDSGERKVAYVALDGGKFEPREIRVGVEAEGGMVEVLDGLDTDEVVVTSGHFLLDTESKLREANAKMRERRRAATTTQKHAGLTTRPSGHEGHGQPASMPANAKFACPMDKHPAETDPDRQGAYFATETGQCPWCGMTLKPIAELAWARQRLAAGGAAVAYTCPDHPYVYANEPGTCPRDGRTLAPFKALRTCRLPEHAGVVQTEPGACPQCDQELVAFRGPWLDEAMAETPASQPTTIAARGIAARGDYVCAMHPTERADTAARCTICEMRLVPAGSLSTADTAPTRIRRSVDHITEHYLAMRRLFASDTEAGLGANALGVAQATEALLEQVDLNEVELDKPTRDAVTRIRRSALKMTGRDLTTDRAHFAELSEGFDRLLDAYRPDRERWEKLTVYRCPMAKARWIQFDDDMGNPYYGSQMLKCGDVQGVK